MGIEKCTWRGAEFQFPRRLDWLTATTTPLGKAQIDHTTLFKFYQRFEDDDTARELFVELTDAFINACGTSLKKQRTDSFFVHGWLRVLSRYGLFKKTIPALMPSAVQKKSANLRQRLLLMKPSMPGRFVITSTSAIQNIENNAPPELVLRQQFLN